MGFLQLPVTLLLLVLSHMFGRFLVAKAFGMRLSKFSGLIPNYNKRDITEDVSKQKFYKKTGWQRVLLFAGGILMNFIVGDMIFAGCLSQYEKNYMPVAEMKQGIYAFPMGEEIGFQTGDKILTIDGKTPNRFKDTKGMKLFFGSEVEVERNGQKKKIAIPDGAMTKVGGQPIMEAFNHQIKIWGIADSSAAKEAGLKANDIFVAVNNTKVQNFGDLKNVLEKNKNGSVELTIERDGQNIDLTSKVNEKGKLGFAPQYDSKAVNTTTPYSLGTSVKYGVKEAGEVIYVNVIGLYKIFIGDIEPVESVQSPIGIARIYGNTWNLHRFWKLTGILSVILAAFLCIPLVVMAGIQVLSR